MSAYVATESFFWTDPEGYNSGPVVAGRTIVHDEMHHLLQTHRHCFRPVRRGELIGGQRSRNATPSRSTTESSVEIRGLPDTPHRPSLPEHVLKQIEGEIHSAFQRFGQTLETAGLLLGLHRTQLWPPRSLVVRATGPGPDSQHGPSSARFYPDKVKAEQPEHLLELGGWHTHPSTDGRPSTTDLETWRRDLEHTGGLAYVGVIACPRDDGTGWMYPVLHPWVVRRSYRGPHVCEPALVVEQ